MKMSKRVIKLAQSPCCQCGCCEACEEKIDRSQIIAEIKDKMFNNAEADFHDCGIWIALNAPDMVDETEVDNV